jgi:hypothetical protein
MPVLSENSDDFFRAGEDIDVLELPDNSQQPPVLERLGPSPFPKGKFPFLGFLATVYDHVSTHCSARARR